MKVKEKIVNILSIIFIVTLFLMSFTFIIFHNTDSATALKDAWSTLGSFFGGIATLTTAYVASILFNDWKIQQKYQNDLKAYDKLCLNSDSFILSYKKFIKSNWHNRINPNETDFMNYLNDYEKLETYQYKLKTEIAICMIILDVIDFNSINNQIMHIGEAIKQLHPSELKKKDYIEQKYIIEDAKLKNLAASFEENYTTLKLSIEKYLHDQLTL